MGVLSNIIISNGLVFVVCITSFQLVLVNFESLRILVHLSTEIFKYLFFTAMKIHIMARIGKETKLYF